MKKFLSILLALSLVLGLCASGVWLLVNVIKEKRGENK